MNTLTKKRNTCRLCNSPKLEIVLPMLPSPIGDAFVPYDQKEVPQPLIPLDLYQCQACGHAQNLDVVNPDILFRNYIFTTGSSPGLCKHFEKYASDMVSSFSLASGSLVVEIGSNDGTLLRFFKDLGMNVIGIDPAREIALKATESGLPTFPEFFSTALAKQIKKNYGSAKLVVANNVYAHSDELSDITNGVAALLDQNGVFVFEVSYLLDIIDNFVFDTIYHEHLSYHSITPFVQFFQNYGLEIFQIEKNSNKGGSMRCFVQRQNGPHALSPIVKKMMDEELKRGLHAPGIFHKYASEIRQRKNAVNAYLDEQLANGKTIAGYGASTTVTTLTYQFELENKLSYLIDDNTKKHALLSPGRHLEVKPSSCLYERNKPDIVVIMAWQYAQPIMQKHTRYVEEGGAFAVPLPELKIIESTTIAVS